MKGLLELGWLWDGLSSKDQAGRPASKLRMFPARLFTPILHSPHSERREIASLGTEHNVHVQT